MKVEQAQPKELAQEETEVNQHNVENFVDIGTRTPVKTYEDGLHIGITRGLSKAMECVLLTQEYESKRSRVRDAVYRAILKQLQDHLIVHTAALPEED
jgi:hypothetical protein